MSTIGRTQAAGSASALLVFANAGAAEVTLPVGTLVDDEGGYTFETICG